MKAAPLKPHAEQEIGRKRISSLSRSGGNSIPRDRVIVSPLHSGQTHLKFMSGSLPLAEVCFTQYRARPDRLGMDHILVQAATNRGHLPMSEGR